MATQVSTTRLAAFQAWSFDKAMNAATQHSPSEASMSSEFFEDRVKIKPDMEAFKESLQEQKGPLFDERYMSSEEALSPMEDDEDDFSGDEIHQAEMVILKSVVKFAVAVCIFHVGKPRVVDVPLPSLTNSPSIQSTASSSSIRSENFLVRPPTPVRSIKRKAILIEKASSIDPVPSIPQFDFMSTSHQITPFKSITSQPRLFKEALLSNSTMSSTTPTPATPAFLTQDPFKNKVPPQRMGHSRLRNLSAKLTRFHLNSPNNTSRLDAALPPTPTFVPPKRTSSTMVSIRKSSLPASPLPTATFTTTATRRKMVPRGAAERAPPIEIPPFPEDDDIVDLQPFPKNTIKRRKSVLGF